VPSEPAESGFAKRIKLKSYPLVERGGVLWAYLGPAERQPVLPEWEFALVPDAQRFVSKRIQECNWLQAMEGGIDSSHVSFLHRGNINSDPLFKGARGNQYNLTDARPGSRWWRAPAASTSARGATPRTGTTTGASPNTCCRPSP
jgi:phthalate 4,5-dioxygenase